MISTAGRTLRRWSELLSATRGRSALLALVASLLVIASLTACVAVSVPQSITPTTTVTVTETSTPAPTPNTSWLFVGDSLTYGYYATLQANRFADRVARDLGAGETVLGYPGGTIATVLASNATLPSAVVTVIELGTNDYSGYRPQGPFMPTSLDVFTAQYRQLLNEVRAPKVICLGVWVPPRQPNSIGLEAEDYDAAIQEVCPGRYVDLLAIFNNAANHNPAGLPTWLGPSDTFHPSDAGHAAIAATIESANGT